MNSVLEKANEKAMQLKKENPEKEMFEFEIDNFLATVYFIKDFLYKTLIKKI